MRHFLVSCAGTAVLLCAACTGDSNPSKNEGPNSGNGSPFGPEVSISVDSPSVVEGDAGTVDLTFTLSLSYPTEYPVSVDYLAKGGSADDGIDFLASRGQLSFSPGEIQKSIYVKIIGDTLDEEDETVELYLSNPASAVLGATFGIGTIQDDDSAPTLSSSEASVTEGNSGKSKLVFHITLDKPSGKPISVDFATADVSAVAPDDYDSVSGQLSFEPGETSKVVTVLVVGDTLPEGNEEFELVLSSPSNVLLASGNASGTIIDDDVPPSGLLTRPSNATCLAPDAPTTAASVSDTRVFRNIPVFSAPVAMVQAPGDSSQWYLAEQGGVVYRFANDDATTTKSVFLDLSSVVDTTSSEGGLLGIAFHPDYANNRYVYVSYTAPGPNSSFPLTSRLSRFESKDGGATLDPSTELDLISMDQPFDYHNGGHITFGPDGYLYMGFGDGGGDPHIYGRSQDTKNLFGSVLRIDVDGGAPYGIPSDNPFAGNPLCSTLSMDIDSANSCPEIYAWGFRNPWRFSFDRATGQLWLGDVGEHDYEEVDIVERGGNYGWNVLESNTCFEPAGTCDASGLIPPVIVYDHTVGQSITGGFVYRGSAIPELIGRYFFVDFISRQIFASTSDAQGNYGYEILYSSNLSLSSLSEDENGEIYGLRYGNGRIHKFIQGGGTANNTIPDLLSDTGCVDPLDPKLPAAGLIPYETVVPFWSDGAVKQRYFALPDGLTVDVDADGDWLFPVGSVLIKNFRLAGKLIETRMFMRHTNGEWRGYTYEWNDNETDATRVVGGKVKNIDGQDWIYPSETQCLICHTDAANSTLGPEYAQLNKEIMYPSTGLTANQLATADAVDILTDPLPDLPANLPALVDPADTGAPLEERVRSYLHVNCSGCHRPSGPTPSNMDLRFETALADTNTCDVVPAGETLGIPDARILAPGDASRSVLIQRMSRRDAYGMPPLGSSEPDANGVALLTTWVDGLSACQ